MNENRFPQLGSMNGSLNSKLRVVVVVVIASDLMQPSQLRLLFSFCSF